MRNDESQKPNMALFWGCFIALITTSFVFIGRVFLANTWATEFGLDGVQAGKLIGIGIWPFAVSIILFSLVIDKIGYKTAMIFAFAGHVVWAVCATIGFFSADKQVGYQWVYWGSLVAALANGTVEAFINPVVATMFSKDKTKWLNILHAGWPGGLVLAGIMTIALEQYNTPWWIRIAILVIPAIIYLLMLIGAKFPVNERVASGVSYRTMLQEFGVLGALVVGFLVSLQLIDFFAAKPDGTFHDTTIYWIIGAAMVVAFGAYTRTLGRPLLFLLILIMVPLATTEIGTDGWISSIMENIAKVNEFNPGWVLVYTSAIMLVLRFFAGPIVHRFSALGLLAISAVLAIAGLYFLSVSTGIMIFIAATLYGLGKTFFWPTMLGVVAEQTPKGGALTLNAISGIGMLAVGVLGFPYIGKLKDDKQIASITSNTEIVSKVPGLVAAGKPTFLDEKRVYDILSYETISKNKLDAAVAAVPDAAVKESVSKAIAEAQNKSSQGALANMAIFPAIMLVAYLGLMAYFKARGGYKPVELGGGGGSAH